MPSMGELDDDISVIHSYDLEDVHLQQPEDKNGIQDAGKDEGTTIHDTATDDEIVDFADSQMLFDLSDFSDDKIFATKQVAALAGLKSPQDVRNLLAVWDVVIQVKRDDNGRAQWSKENVEKLQEMLTVKKAKGLSVKAVVDYYLEPAEEVYDDLMLPQDLSNKEALETVTKMIRLSVENVLDKKTEKLQEDNEKILRQIEENKKDAETSMQQVVEMIKGLQENQKKLQDEQKARDDEIKRLKEENETLKTSLEEQKKKKTFFGIPIKNN